MHMYIHMPPTEGIGNSKGGGCVLKLNGYFLELHKIILFYEILFIVSS